MPELIDRYNRNLKYLRISITDRCNLRCAYCGPPGYMPRLPHEEILRYEEILRLARVGAKLGITKARVTGGEPLVRKGVYTFLKDLSRVEGLEDVSLTTNGVLLAGNIERIRAAGIRRINISLDTLKPEKYHEITGWDSFAQVWEAILLALKAGFDPVKLNVVALRGINEDELANIAALSFDYPFHIRFIEHMPVGTSRLQTNRPLLAPEISSKISVLGRMHPVARSSVDGPAERYAFEGARGEIGFIPAVSRHFCRTCNRLRLTASGQLRPCLLSDRQEDIKSPLRRGASDEELAGIFLKAAQLKPFHHHLEDGCGGVSDQMFSIGG